MKRLWKTMIKRLIPLLALAAIFYRVLEKKKKEISEYKNMSDKHFELFMLMNQWVKVKLRKKSIVSYLEERGFRNIAIYGLSYAGDALVEELQDSNICICYGIDKQAEFIYQDFDVISPDMDLRKVDAVIVTTVMFFDEIKEQLKKKMDCPIISLENILYGM